MRAAVTTASSISSERRSAVRARPGASLTAPRYLRYWRFS